MFGGTPGIYIESSDGGVAFCRHSGNDNFAYVTDQGFFANVWGNVLDVIQITDTAVVKFKVTHAGNITVVGTVDGRNVSTDGTKLDTIDTNADVTGDNPPQAHTIASHSDKIEHTDMLGTYATRTLTFTDTSATNWIFTIEDGVITDITEET